VALAQVRQTLSTDFLRSDSLFEAGPADYVSLREYEAEKIAFVKQWVARSQFQAAVCPDDEQALAIAAVDLHVQLVARAGSGKTETIANRAVFLQGHCGVAPTEMLLLAFTRDAAQEMAERVGSKLGKQPLPHIMTFHALAYALVPGAKALLVNGRGGADQSLDRVFQSVLLDVMAHPSSNVVFGS
jgi:DNA helicase-4